MQRRAGGPGLIFLSVSGEIGAFMAKVTVQADDDLLCHYPKSWPARLGVTTPTGKHERLVIHVPGDPERPFDEHQVAAKFQRLATPLIGERAADDLLRLSLAVLEEEGKARVLLAEVEKLFRDWPL